MGVGKYAPKVAGVGLGIGGIVKIVDGAQRNDAISLAFGVFWTGLGGYLLLKDCSCKG